MIGPSVVTHALFDRIGAYEVGLRSKQRSLGPFAGGSRSLIRVALELRGGPGSGLF
jgi:hypothetical protein